MDNTLSNNEFLLTDQTTIAGLFKNFQYAYTFKDTLIYGKLLSRDFTFMFRDYEQLKDVTWGREEEMKVNYGLFENTQRLDLIWNNIVAISGDSTNIIRSFNLTVTFNPTDVIFIDGKVNLSLRKENNVWKIVNWIDESNF